ncbi:hypothetical protein RK794_03600 [Streptococcus pneumoniae]|uniref:hypothetical protein n=1 Tax=Streptococcus pneumoniae TaxID=1313 RepID=UPI000198BA82|nr:hypothetical protein [Streptococcus pneumoniae]ELU93541.1 hypothetical protein PNI0446_00377 [Streptococcus pneumoniae PNI0446]ACO20555.1 conserved hypothetical protein [Streptococcus pneumoniae P1031]ELU79674.1 hypothetical protein PNI0153_01162 [Streptococcus pneumoniae PNI0153]ELU85471.1 hypothetical protein PNI0076_00208 [Streptococcus pneumoniae PNI0076]ELU86984.1 hypothetical protein PNI0199_00506 [Streptococcus pneumoniae PNI0199]
MSRKSTNFSSPLPTLKVLFSGFYFYHFILLSFGVRIFEKNGRIFEKKKGSLTYEKITKNFCYI